MQIKDLDRNLLLTYLILQDDETAMRIAQTERWAEEEVIDVTVQFNGVEMPAEYLEEALKKWVKHIEAETAEFVDKDKFEERVEERAKQLLKDHANDALEKIRALEDKLTEVEDVLTPHWER